MRILVVCGSLFLSDCSLQAPAQFGVSSGTLWAGNPSETARKPTNPIRFVVVDIIVR